MVGLTELYKKRLYLYDKVAACNWTNAVYAILSRDFVAHSRDKIVQENCFCRCDIGLDRRSKFLVRETWSKELGRLSSLLVRVFSRMRNLDELEHCSILYEKLGGMWLKCCVAIGYRSALLFTIFLLLDEWNRKLVATVANSYRVFHKSPASFFSRIITSDIWNLNWVELRLNWVKLTLVSELWRRWSLSFYGDVILASSIEFKHRA